MISTVSELNSVIQKARIHNQIALDTEFVWEKTYSPKLGVIQMSFGENDCFLVDPLAMETLDPIAKMLANPSIVKILHDAKQDLLILSQITGAYPQNIFDTRRAAGFMGLRSTTSLVDLTRTLIGIELPKTQTRTNWLQRPLSPEQSKYALNDVRYLCPLFDKLTNEAKNLNHEPWLQEEMEQYNNKELYDEMDPYQQFWRIKGVGKLHGQDLSVLRELTAWRELEARKRDRPRGWIIIDEILVKLAQEKPLSIKKLKTIKGLRLRGLERYGEYLIDAIQRGISINPEEYPVSPHGKREINSDKSLIDFCFSFIKGKSQSLKIDSALLATRADIKAIIRHTREEGHRDDNRILKGWRKKAFGEELQSLLSVQAMFLSKNIS